VLAEHPPESSATIEQAKLARFTLGKAQELDVMTKGLAAAEAMPAGPDKAAAVKIYQDQISARGYTGKWQNVAPLLSAGTALMKAAETELDPATKTSMQSQAGAMFKQAGVVEDKPAGGAVVYDRKTGQVKVGGVVLPDRAKDDAAARALVTAYETKKAAAPAAASTPSTPSTPSAPVGLIDSTKYTRVVGPRGNYIYTRGARGAGRTKAEWAALEGE